MDNSEKKKLLEETVSITMDMLKQELDSLTGEKVQFGLEIHNVPIELFSTNSTALYSTHRKKYYKQEYILNSTILIFSKDFDKKGDLEQ